MNEFFFSFSLLAFLAGLLLLGTVILVDAFRRFAQEWKAKAPSPKQSNVVLFGETARPAANGIRNRASDFIQPVVISDKKAG